MIWNSLIWNSLILHHVFHDLKFPDFPNNWFPWSGLCGKKIAGWMDLLIWYLMHHDISNWNILALDLKRKFTQLSLKFYCRQTRHPCMLRSDARRAQNPRATVTWSMSCVEPLHPWVLLFACYKLRMWCALEVNSKELWTSVDGLVLAASQVHNNRISPHIGKTWSHHNLS